MKRTPPARIRSRCRPAPLPRREAILDAALQLIEERGTEQITHRSVAAAAGVPLGSTTYYFASRDELVREAFRRYVTRVLAFLSEILAELPPRDAAGLVELLLEVARREVSGRWTLILEYELVLRAARDPELAADFQRCERALVSGLAEALEGLGAPQPFESARTLIALVRGFELDGLTRGDADLGDLKRRLLPIVEQALRPTHSRPKEKT
jgi:DNA-binding transcriptional regulator YbjK